MANGDLDFEAKNAYTLTVQVRDADIPEFVDEAVIQITVHDENESPVVTPQQKTLHENSQESGVIATMAATDQDAGAAGTLTWSLSAGNTAGAFTIDQMTGEVELPTRPRWTSSRIRPFR